MLSYLKRYGYLPPEAETALLPLFQVLKKTKGSFLVKEGQHLTGFFLLKKGVVRSFFKKGNTEFTQWFSVENENVAATHCLYDHELSQENIECLEDCEFVFIACNDLNRLCERYNALNTIYRKLIEEYCKLIEERLYIRQTMTAAERYEILLRERPELIRRVSLGHIASYLGITQETLSRIRSK